MQGRREPQAMMLAFVDLEERVPPNHPLRVVNQFADRALRELSSVFDQMYAAGGRPSIPSERLLKASLLIALYSVRSKRAFCEELDYQLLFRWFLDMELLEPSFDQTTFSKNRQRLLQHAVAQRFFDEVVRQADGLGLLSDEHFSVDGTLIEAAVSLKSFRPKDGPPSPPPPKDQAQGVGDPVRFAPDVQPRRRDELAVLEYRARTDQRDEVGCVDGPPPGLC
jgi:transposase